MSLLESKVAFGAAPEHGEGSKSPREIALGILRSFGGGVAGLAEDGTVIVRGFSKEGEPKLVTGSVHTAETVDWLVREHRVTDDERWTLFNMTPEGEEQYRFLTVDNNGARWADPVTDKGGPTSEIVLEADKPPADSSGIGRTVVSIAGLLVPQQRH